MLISFPYKLLGSIYTENTTFSFELFMSNRMPCAECGDRALWPCQQLPGEGQGVFLVVALPSQQLETLPFALAASLSSFNMDQLVPCFENLPGLLTP